MKRRQVLQILGSASIIVSSSFLGISRYLRSSTSQLKTIPYNLLVRLNRRTKPLDLDNLDQPHNLAG